MARSAQTPSRSAGGISGKRLRKTGVEREEGPASRAGIDRVRVVRLKLLIVLDLNLFTGIAKTRLSRFRHNPTIAFAATLLLRLHTLWLSAANIRYPASSIRWRSF